MFIFVMHIGVEMMPDIDSSGMVYCQEVKYCSATCSAVQPTGPGVHLLLKA